VDAIVQSQITDIKSEFYDPNLLLGIYRGLWLENFYVIADFIIGSSLQKMLKNIKLVIAPILVEYVKIV
jgi:hypothetical protein